jgi:uncharacterized protein (DUF362 family)
MRKRPNSDRTNGISRRDFLRTAAIGAAAATVGPLAVGTAARSAQAAASTTAQANPTVVDVRSAKWRVDGTVDADFVRKMIEHGMARLTGKKTLADAWRVIVKPTDVVGIKFNNLSHNYTNANQAVLDAIIAGLVAAGVEKEKIIVTEAVGATWQNAIAPKTHPYGEPQDIGNGKAVGLSPFITDQVDCLINVPNIKDHGGAGITGCLKNISHSRTIMSRPIHDDACSPAIVGVNKLEPIRKKRRLNIVNGLLAIFNGGPGTAEQFRWEHNGLLFATDPVACDRVQIELIDAERKRRGLAGLFNRGSKPKHVENAAKAGLGIADLDKINWIKAFKQE